MKTPIFLVRLLFVLLVTVVSPMNQTSAQAAVAFVQQNAKEIQAVASGTLSLGSSTTGGNLLVVGLYYASSVSVLSVMDSQGNPYSPVGTEVSPPSGAFRSSLYYAKNIVGGFNTVTVTLSGVSAAVPLGIYLDEYSGVDRSAPLDASAQRTGSAASVTSGTLTTSAAGDLVAGYCIAESRCSLGTGFTARSSFAGNLIEDRTATSAGSYSAVATSDSGWTMTAAAFKPASATPTVPVIASFTANPAGITAGQSSTLSFSVSGNPVPTLTIDNGVGAVSGTVVSVRPTQTTTYTLTAGNSQGSAQAKAVVSVGAADTTPPSVPGNLQGTAFSSQVIILTWSPSTDSVVAGQTASGVAGYRVYRNGTPVALTGVQTSYQDTGLTANTTYGYALSAYDAAGNFSQQTSVVQVSTTAGPAYPVKVGSSGRYLVDQNGIPFLLAGDSPQSLIVNLSEADADIYLADRHDANFNAVWVNLLCNTTTGGRADGSTFDGIVPFTRPGDLSTPNEAYFSRADDMIRLAAKYGITVVLDPIETAGWLGTLLANGNTLARAYGQYLGNRYKNFDNIIWLSGNDFQTYTTPANDAAAQAVALGIRDMDTRHLHTVELNYNVSASLDDSTWAPIIGLDAAYTYFPTYAELLNEYNRAAFKPTFLVEANYEFENNTGSDYGSPETLRRQEYWTALSGATGQLYGNHYTWQFSSGWQGFLGTTGSAQFGYLQDLLDSHRWWDLIPDQNHTFVTAGYGSFTSSGAIGANDYVTAAITADGQVGLAYLPVRTSVTVNMARFAGPVTVQWFDPSSAVYTAVAGSPFPNTGSRQMTPAGNNNDGAGDWVLVFTTTASSSDTTPPVVSMAAPVNGATVSGTITVSANATDDVGVAGVQFRLDGSMLGGEVALSPYLMPWDTTLSTNGFHALSAVARDAANNTATASVSVTVANPPRITGVAATGITVSGAAIGWTTANEPADSQVEFGTTTAYGTLTAVDPTLVTAHSVPLANLSGNTLYHYRVRSTDPKGATSLSGDFTFTTASGQPAAVTFVQGSAVANNNAATSTARAFTSATAAGNLLVAIVTFDSSGSTTVGLSDTQGNIWRQASFGVDTRHNQTLGIFYAENTKGGADTVTAAYAGANTYGRLIILEYSGVAASSSLDAAAKSTGTGTAVSSGPVTTTLVGDLIIGAMMDDLTATNTATAGAGYTLRSSVGNYLLTGESEVSAAAGSVAATFSLRSSSDWLCQVAAFKAKR